MITDLTLCLSSSAAYYLPLTVTTTSKVRVLIQSIEDTNVIAFRGSADEDDWMRDFDAIPVENHYLGICHQGFLTGAQSALPLLKQYTEKPFIITGHSLGGALAIMLGALLMVNGIKPLKIVTFGAPNTGIADNIPKILESVPGNRYRNGDDPVPDIPPWPYQSDRPHTQIGKALLNPIEDHMLDRYYSALVEWLQK